MNLDKTSQIFFGCKIDSKLREALHNAKPGDRRYFEDPEAGFLRILEVHNSEKKERWIGKVSKAGLNLTEVEDIHRNVLSILRRIAAGVRISPSSIKMFVVTGETDSHSESVSAPDDQGPYIDYSGH